MIRVWKSKCRMTYEKIDDLIQSSVRSSPEQSHLAPASKKLVRIDEAIEMVVEGNRLLKKNYP